MAAPLTEFVFESVLRDGLNELRVNPSLLDDIFKRFTEAHFNNQYGQAKIDEIKTYIQNNQIKLIQALSQIPTHMPCISIQLMASEEAEEDQQFFNQFEQVSAAKTPAVIVPTITPGSYDTVTGKLTITNAADLSVICPGMDFVDNAGTTFTIGTGNSNLAGNKFINIGQGKEPDLGGDGRIDSSVDRTLTQRRMVRLRESINIGCHSKDNVHLAKFMYIIVTYILKSRQQALITRGIHLDAGHASMFDRELEFEGENIFSRFIEVSCLTEFNWNQDDVSLLDCFDLTVTAEDIETGVKIEINTDDDC